MLDDASKYECLDVANLEGFITGSIMPKRDILGNGSSRAMRYEDLLFLQEAYNERKRAVGVSCGTTPCGRMASASRFSNAAWIDPRLIHDADGYAFTNRGNYIGDDIDLDGFGVMELDAYGTFENCGMLMGSSPGDLSRPSYGERLRADHVRQAYKDLKYFSRTFRLVPMPDIATANWTNTVISEDGSSTSSTGSGDWYGSLYSTGMNTRTGSGSMRYSFTFKAMPEIHWSSACWWAFVVEVSHSVRTSESDSTSETRRFLMFQPCGEAPASPNLAAVASRSLAAAGCSYSPIPYFSENESVMATVKEMALVADHAFPSDFSSLNWNWEPSA